jgi:hypothetical protein
MILKGSGIPHEIKGCGCLDSDAKTCYWLRYPNQMELDGRDYCLCKCHDDDCNCQECSDRRIL